MDNTEQKEPVITPDDSTVNTEQSVINLESNEFEKDKFKTQFSSAPTYLPKNWYEQEAYSGDKLYKYMDGTGWTVVGDSTSLADVTLGGAASSISSGTITARKYLKVVFISPATRSASTNTYMTFNGSATGYNWCSNLNGGTTQSGGGNEIRIHTGITTDGQTFISLDIINIATQKKYLNGQFSIISDHLGIFGGDWSNTSDQITSISFSPSSGTFPAGTQLIVMGSD